MKLNLRKPLIFFDLETTGLNIMTDRIVEIAYLKVYPNGNEESKKMRINPGMHIPEESTEVHHISDEDVKEKSGCKKDVSVLVISLIGLSSLLALLKKKK